ncbi:MAG: secretin N-terminal domain-containing protein [Syntrophorhabdaceae bacterium]|nr:secretin N-terminal domain-containing protein [Syntrophorhabdaceae bacterium]
MMTNCGKLVFFGCLFFTLTVSPSYGDDNPRTAIPRQVSQHNGATEGPSSTGPLATQPSEKAKKLTARASSPVSLSFDDADMYQVIQTVFGEILRVNYVVDQRVKGRVTFRSVTPIEGDRVLSVMEVILRLNGVGVVEEGDLYRIVPISDVAREPAEVTVGRDPDSIEVQGKSIIRVVPVMYSQSAEIIKLITPFLTTTAVVIDVSSINHIMLVDTDANVKRLLKLIDLFDSEQTRKKKPQVFVYHVQNSKAKDIANILQQVFLSSGRGGAANPPLAASPSASPKTSASKESPVAAARSALGGLSGSDSHMGEGLVSPITKIIAEENLNSLVILSSPEDYEVIKEAIRRVDIIPRQVVIEGVIAEISLKDDLKLGVSWALQFSPGGMNGVLGALDGTVGFDVPGATSTSTTDSGTFNFAGTVGGDFKAVIDMLATQSKAKLLAVPRILVTDNKEARIQVGEQVPIVTTETIASTTTAAQRTIQYKDIGIILKVKPRINEGGLVTLDLAQEVSSYDTITLFDGETNIIVKKTEATTNLVVQDGQTVLIGGLIREDTSTARSGIPYLSKIPLLGYLFGSTTDENHRKELIILLTPRVIKNQWDARKATSSYVDDITKTGKGKLKKEELIRDVPQEERDGKKDEVRKQPTPEPVRQIREGLGTKKHEMMQSEVSPAAGDTVAQRNGVQKTQKQNQVQQSSNKTTENGQSKDREEPEGPRPPGRPAVKKPAPEAAPDGGGKS